MRLHNAGNYVTARRAHLRQVEGVVHFAYVDSQGIPTIGVGFNLRDHGLLVLQTLGFDVSNTTLTGAALVAENEYIQEALAIFSRKYPADNSANNQAFADLNAMLARRANDARYGNSKPTLTSFSLSDLQIDSVFDALMDGYQIVQASWGTRRNLHPQAPIGPWRSCLSQLAHFLARRTTLPM